MRVAKGRIRRDLSTQTNFSAAGFVCCLSRTLWLRIRGDWIGGSPRSCAAVKSLIQTAPHGVGTQRDIETGAHERRHWLRMNSRQQQDGRLAAAFFLKLNQRDAGPWRQLPARAAFAK